MKTRTNPTCEHGATSLMTSTQYCTADCNLEQETVEQEDIRLGKRSPTPTPLSDLSNEGLRLYLMRGVQYGAERDYIVKCVNAHEGLLARVRIDGMAFHQADNKYNLHEPLFHDCKHVECLHYKTLIAQAEGK